MRYRRLGRTGFMVSEIGFGAWGIGRSMWIGAQDDVSLKALRKAVDLGVNFVDTALAYGTGHSEQLIARLLKERNERIYVATKIPPKNQLWPAPPESTLADVFPSDYIIACTEKSLKNLGVECLDLQQFHVWNDAWTGRHEWQETVNRLKKEGKVRHFGISINDYQPENGLGAADTGLIDAFQVIYNIFEQAPEDRLFPYCREHDLGVIVRVPLDEGTLTGNITPKTTFPKGDFRNEYFRGNRRREVMEHVEHLRFLLHDGVETLADAALRFCLSHETVSTVIAGMRTPEHVEANCRISDGRGLPKDDLAALRSHVWPHNYYL
ncbi:MAG: aldo/keto reductase [Acidobacteriia bacterium]|nr:aldo/keto reductase [Terriglobia bacterium]